MDELNVQKESEKIASTNSTLEQSLLTLAEVIEPLPKSLKELQLEIKGKKPEQNLDSNSRLDELNTKLSQLATLESTLVVLVERIASLEETVNNQAERIQRINQAIAHPTQKLNTSKHPPLIPVILVAAIVGAVLTYGLIQFFPSQSGILSRIYSRVNDIQIILQKNTQLTR